MQSAPKAALSPQDGKTHPIDAMTNSIPATFKQCQYANYGTADQEWKLVEVAQKPLQDSYVRIKVVYAALNPVDYKLAERGASWASRTPTEEAPYVVGFDAAGVVVEVGSDVNDFTVGDDVYACTPITDFGTVAEYITIDAQYVAPKPKNLDFKSAAGVPLACLTSYQALVTFGKVLANERVLILGGSSSTGLFGIQLAKAVGAHVIATTSERNFDLVKSLGTDQVIDYGKEKWVDMLEEHSIDVILDCGFESQTWNNVAQKVLKKSTGRFVTLTKIALPNPAESPIGATLIGIFCVPSGADLREITALIEHGQVKSTIDSVYPFENVVEAADKLKGSRLSGKVVIAVAEE